MKQENAAEDSAAVIESIASQFQKLNLPRLADAKIYLGTPFPTLENIRNAINEQRDENETARFFNRMRYAGITKERTVDTFEWDDKTYPVVEPGAIEHALSIEFIALRKNLIIAGPPGAGKSMLATIVACKAIRAEFTVKYKTAHCIATELKEARTGNSLSGYVKKHQACDVLVIEDVTFATFDKTTAQSFFAVIDGRYGRKTTVITSNGSISEWAGNFPDKSMSSAILGRFYEEAILINMNGAEDMRLKKAKVVFDGTANGGKGDMK